MTHEDRVDAIRYQLLGKYKAMFDKVLEDEKTKILADVERELLANGFIVTHYALDVWHDITKRLRENTNED